MNDISNELPIFIAFRLVFAAASITLSDGARLLPSEETASLSKFEMPLAPVLTLVILSKTPTFQVILEGGIVSIAVLGSQSSKM